MAVLRPAGKTWTAPQLVISGAQVIADHAGIGDNGTVIVTWESYNATCAKYGCSLSAYVLHASRQNAGTGIWMDSGSLMGPDNTAHDARAALDSAGGAILVASSKSGAYVSATEGNSGGGWSSFVTAFNPSGQTMVSNLLSDDAGQVTLAYEAIGFSSSQALVVNGSINSNTWSSPVVLSGSDSGVSQIYLAVAPGGAALAVWVTFGSTSQIHAVRRATATGSWSSPVVISGPGSQIGPEAAAVNSAGDAIVIYSGYDASSIHTEYAVNYQP
jgi:hypothetical protein